MNKSKQIMFASTLICFYLISKLIPINFNFGPKSGIILGLGFIFIKKEHRILVTTIYQAIGFGNLIALIKSFDPNLLFNAVTYIIEKEPTSLTNDVFVLTPLKAVLLYIEVLYPGALLSIYCVFGIVGIATCLIGLIIDLSLYIALFTAPYSYFFVFKKIGFYEKIQRRTGNRFDEVLS